MATELVDICQKMCDNVAWVWVSVVLN